MGKRDAYVGFKLDSEEKQRLATEAGGRPLAAVVRERLFSKPPTENVGNTAQPATPKAGGLAVYHVDEIGADPWRRDNGALKK